MKFNPNYRILIALMTLLALCTGCAWDCGSQRPIMRGLPPNLRAYLDDVLFDYDTWLFTSDAGDTMVLKREADYDVFILKYATDKCKELEYKGGDYIGTAPFTLRYNQDSSGVANKIDALELRIVNGNPQASPININYFLARFKWSNRSDSLLSDPSETYDNYAVRNSFSFNDTLYNDVLVPTDSLPMHQLIISKGKGLLGVYSLDGNRILTLKSKK